MMSQLDPRQAHKLWLQAQEMVKDRVIAPTLYRALELGVGITVDGDHFVLGFSSADLPMASLLRSSQHQAIIEQCISEVLKKKVRLRIVEGTSIEDYENWKRQQAAREATATTISARREQERAVEQAWEEVGEKITRTYARMHLRQLPQAKAAFMREAFKVINQAVDQLGYTEASDEIHHRSLARVFEKFATVVGVPSAMLAYEFFRLRGDGKLS